MTTIVVTASFSFIAGFAVAVCGCYIMLINEIERRKKEGK